MFTKEELMQWGLAEEQAEQIVEKARERLDDNFVSKERFNEVNTERQQLKEQIKERDEQIESLKKVDPKELEGTIESLKKENEEKEKKYEKGIQQLKINYIAERQIREAKARDLKSVLAHVDLTDAELQEDGTIKGLNEQLEELAKEKEFLFEVQQGAKKPEIKGANLGSSAGQSKEGSGVNLEKMSYEELVDYYSKQ